MNVNKFSPHDFPDGKQDGLLVQACIYHSISPCHPSAAHGPNLTFPQNSPNKI